MTLLTAIVLAMAILPACLYWRNTRQYRLATSFPERPPSISLLIPARNEAMSIEAAVRAALASTQVHLEVIVLDDHSDDDTRGIVEAIADEDDRVRVESAPPLPEGWCGKQHACHVLSQLASHEYLAFVDADVRVAPDGLARAWQFLHETKADLVSGIPRQETGTLFEKLLIPLIHFLLLGFLPMKRMRRSPMVNLGAGCGQFFLVRRDAYERSGGHAAIRTTLHDGLKLPRLFRQAGLRTDLFDATDVATCRMYCDATQVWFGLAKNAREGLGSAKLIVPFTILLLGGQVGPFVLLAFAWTFDVCTALICIAVLAAWYPRFDGVVRFRQSLMGAILHPLGVFILLNIQWFAVLRSIGHRPTTWRGRAYHAASTSSAFAP